MSEKKLQSESRQILLQLKRSHFNYLHYMQTKSTFWLRVWLFDRVHLYQSICGMDLYFNEAVRELEWSRSQENRPLDLDKSLFCHNTPDFWISFPVNHIQKKIKYGTVFISHAWNPSNCLSSPTPPVPSSPLQKDIKLLAEHRLVHYDHRPGAVR